MLSLKQRDPDYVEWTPKLKVIYTCTESAKKPDGDTKTVRLQTEVKNISAEDINGASLITALYYEDKPVCIKLLDMSVLKNSSCTKDYEMSITRKEDLYTHYDVRFFVWNNTYGIVPIAAAEKSVYTPADYFTTSNITPWLRKMHLTSDTDVSNGVIGGELGQMTYALAISPFDNNIIISGTDTVGIWRSEDGGNTWENTSSGLAYAHINDLICDDKNSGTVYAINAGSPAAVRAGDTDMGIYKSVDNGITWQQDLYAKYTLTQLGGRNQLTWYTHNGTRYLYAATMGSGIYRLAADTADAQWEQVYNGTDTFYDIYGTSNTLIAVSSAGMKKSSDGGITWEDISIIIDNVAISPRCITVNPQNEKMWLTVDDTSLYKTEDAGVTWVRQCVIADNGTSVLVGVKFTNYREKNAPYNRLFISYNRMPNALKYSDDLCETINRTEYYDVHGNYIVEESFWAQVFDSSSDASKVYMFHRGYAESVDGGATWIVKKAQRLSGIVMTDMEFDSAGMPYRMSTIDVGIWGADKLNKLGALSPTMIQKNFIRYDGNIYGDGEMSSSGIEIDPNNSMHLLALTGNCGYGSKTAVVQSFDGGATWLPITDKDGNHISENKGISFLRYDPSDANTIYAGYLKSTDNGQTWKKISPIISASEGNSDVYMQIADISSDGRLMTYQKENSDHNIYISTDGGDSWTAHDTGVYSISSAMFDKQDCNVVWMGKFDRLMKRDLSKGENSTCITGVYSIRQIAQNPHNTNHLMFIKKNVTSYRLSEADIYETFDGGKSWHTLTGYPKVADAISMIFHPDEPIVYIGTYLGTMIYNYEYHRNYIESK